MRTPPRQQTARFRFSPLVAAFACAFGSQAALGATYTVNVGGDPAELVMPSLSLRYAILSVNSDCVNAPHTINFSGALPFVISPSSELPAITCPAVTIQGPGSGQVTVDGSFMLSAGCGLTASSPSTRIEGLTVRSFSYGGSSSGLCGTMEAVGDTVHNNDKGFYLSGGSTLSGNEVYANAYGIYDTGSGLTLSSNTIRDNSAIGVVGGDGAVANGNQIHGNGQTGIYLGSNALVTGNTIYSNGGEGITVGNLAVVKGNTIHGHTVGAGIYLYGVGTVGGPLGTDRNVIYGNSTGVNVGGGGGTIENNYIGVTADGDTAAGNGDGIAGGSVAGLTVKNNVISSNTYNGISIYDIGTLDIQGNKVGTNASGTAPLGNGGAGISAYFSYGGQITGNVVAANTGGGINLGDVNLTISNNQVGGAGAFQNGASALELDSATGGAVTGNILSGSANCGITTSFSSNVSITGNKIGTDASGTVGVANGVCGIDVYSGSSLSITGNQISANGFYGGVILDSSSGVTLQGNLIGTAADGITALSNNGPGVTISGFSNVLAYSATDLEPKVAKILSGNMLLDNVIAHNNGDGVKLVNGTSNNTIAGSVSGQSIHSNNGKNINLDYAGAPRPNDDPDGTVSGPNGGQNRPAITSVVEDSGSTVIQGSLLSFAAGIFINDLPFNGQFEIDLYGNDVASVPAGKTWLGKTTAITNATGNATFTATIPGTGFGYVTATATGPFGTSEFSDTQLALVPAASITPMSVPFGNVVVGATATTPTEVEFRSNGSGDYVIDSISQGATAPTCPGTSTPVCATGDFSCSVSCTTGTLYPPLAPTAPASCKISGLSFHPSAIGAQSTTLWVCDNTSATARGITFSGTGMPHVVTVSQSFHDFGNVSIGTQVASPSILVTNGSGNPPAMLGTPVVSSPFSVGSNTCGSSLAPGASCNFTVVYAPTVIGPNSGAFSMTVANGNPVVVDLQGAGVSTAVGQLPLPAGIDFGTAVLASAPLQHALTLQNTGNGPVNISSITATAPFGMSHDCPASLAPSASCTVNLSFAPLVYGNTTGQLTVASDAGSGTQVVTLLATVAGTGYALSPWDVAFGGVPVGTTSTPRPIAVSNNGENAIPLSDFAVSGPYTIVGNDCGATLAPATFCTVQVAFEPVAPGSAEGTFTAQVGLTGAPPAVATLSGTGTQQATLVLPGVIDFGAILRGSVPSASRAVELRNTGNATLTFTTGVTGPFTLSGDCGASLAPGAACTLTIGFVPSTVGDFAGSLDISSNAPGGSGSIPIRASVQAQPRADLRVDVSEMGFGDRMIGTRSAPQRVTISNVGLVAAQLGVLPPSRDFLTTSQCGATLAPGASCTADVVFLPMATGLRYNQLQFTSDAPGSPFGVNLNGRGCSPPRPGRPPSCN